MNDGVGEGPTPPPPQSGKVVFFYILVVGVSEAGLVNCVLFLEGEIVVVM